MVDTCAGLQLRAAGKNYTGTDLAIRRGPPRKSVRKRPKTLDVGYKTQRMLEAQPFGSLGLASLECLDDLQVINDGTGGSAGLRNCRAADSANMNIVSAYLIDQGLRTTQCDERLMKSDIDAGISVEAFETGGFWNSSNKRRRAVICASSALNAASRTANDSSAAHI